MILKISNLTNPINWFKIFMSPIKSYKLVLKVVSDYPRIQNLFKIKNKKLRKFIINFYTTLVKKNNNLNYFFLEKNKTVNEIYFNSKDFTDLNPKIFESLAYNGIIFIENILTNKEVDQVLKYFTEIEKKDLSTKWENNTIINASNVKYKNDINVNISYAKKDLSYLPELNQISQTISSKVFGRSIKSYAEFFLHEAINYEQNNYQDTNFHVDRYLPCLKIIYTPDGIDFDKAPFGFVKKTHKLDNSLVMNMLLNSNSDMLNDKNTSYFAKSDEIKGICKKNTLIVAFTNGIHKRNIFLEKRVSRKTIFLQYTDNFNMLSLINYFKFNKKENKKVNHNSVLQ